MSYELQMQRKQRRYFAGRVPKGLGEESEGSRSSADSDVDRAPRASRRQPAPAVPTSRGEKKNGSATKKPKGRPRSRPRIQAKLISVEDALPPSSSPSATPKPPVTTKPTGFAPIDDEEECYDDMDGSHKQGSGEKSESSSGSYSSDSDSSSQSSSGSERSDPVATSRNPPSVEGEAPRPSKPPIQAPVFLSRAQRDAMSMSAGVGSAAGSRQAEARRAAEKEEREHDARISMLRVAREKADTDYDLAHVDMAAFPDDTDFPEEKEAEFALWRVRELKRVMHERGMSIDDEGGEDATDTPAS